MSHLKNYFRMQGTHSNTNMEDSLEMFQTALDPPPSYWHNMLKIFGKVLRFSLFSWFIKWSNVAAI